MKAASRPTRAALCAALALMTMGMTCRAKPEPDYNGLGAALIQQAKWSEAADMFKARLARDARDVAAHFNLGRCYLNGTVCYPAAAAGEFQLALQLFTGNGRHSPIAEYSDVYFEMRCHLELAKVYLRLYQGARTQGGSPELLRGLVGKMRQACEAARALEPASPDVQQLETIIKQL